MAARQPEAEVDRAESLHLSVPHSLIGEMRALAERSDRTISREAQRAFRAHIERERRRRQPEEVKP